MKIITIEGKKFKVEKRPNYRLSCNKCYFLDKPCPGNIEGISDEDQCHPNLLFSDSYYIEYSPLEEMLDEVLS